VETGVGKERSGGAPLHVLYLDAACAVVWKPSGVLVHPTTQAPDRDTMLSRARERLGRWVYPVHRLDRSTSGVLLLALSPAAARELGLAFRDGTVTKTYRAVVRGHTAEEGRIDYALAGVRGNAPKPALTCYRRLAAAELPFAVGRYPTARYSLVEVQPLSGRLHQIRRHFAHISHPVVGDTRYGDGRHNRVFREFFGLHRLLLTAESLTFRTPEGSTEVTVGAPADPELEPLMRSLGWGRLRQTSAAARVSISCA
jgi:tRNA pseudouridine65 synthase